MLQFGIGGESLIFKNGGIYANLIFDFLNCCLPMYGRTLIFWKKIHYKHNAVKNIPLKFDFQNWGESKSSARPGAAQLLVSKMGR